MHGMNKVEHDWPCSWKPFGTFADEHTAPPPLCDAHPTWYPLKKLILCYQIHTSYVSSCVSSSLECEWTWHSELFGNFTDNCTHIFPHNKLAMVWQWPARHCKREIFLVVWYNRNVWLIPFTWFITICHNQTSSNSVYDLPHELHQHSKIWYSMNATDFCK